MSVTVRNAPSAAASPSSGRQDPVLKRVTLSQIATYAGVSSATASFVLSRRRDMRISVSTEKRVLEAARTLGYVPRRTPPNVSQRQLPDIGFISDTVASDAFAGELLQGASRAAAERDRTLLVTESEGTPALEAASIDRLLALGVSDFILGSTGVWNRPVPQSLIGRSLVLLNCVDPGATVHTVLPDDYAAGRSVATALLDQDHVRIQLVGSVSPASVAGHSRLRGITDALRDEGVSLAGTTECQWLPVEARRAAVPLLSRPEATRPTAVIAINDRVALGVYQAAQIAGLGIPEDLSVVSFDDSDLAYWLNPGLTSARIPHIAMGRLAVQLLAEPSPAERHHVPLTLTLRESIAPPSGVSTSPRPPRETRANEYASRLRPTPHRRGYPPSGAVRRPRQAAHEVTVSPTGDAQIGLDELPHIGHPAIRALRSAGFPTLLQLAGVPRQRLLALRDVGPKAIAAIEDALGQHGLSLG